MPFFRSSCALTALASFLITPGPASASISRSLQDLPKKLGSENCQMQMTPQRLAAEVQDMKLLCGNKDFGRPIPLTGDPVIDGNLYRRLVAAMQQRGYKVTTVRIDDSGSTTFFTISKTP